jgi:hypothetical protein
VGAVARRPHGRVAACSRDTSHRDGEIRRGGERREERAGLDPARSIAPCGVAPYDRAELRRGWRVTVVEQKRRFLTPRIVVALIGAAAAIATTWIATSSRARSMDPVRPQALASPDAEAVVPVVPRAVAVVEQLPRGSAWVGTTKCTNSAMPIDIVMWVTDVQDDRVTCVTWFPTYNAGVLQTTWRPTSTTALEFVDSSVLFGAAAPRKPGLLEDYAGDIALEGETLTANLEFMDGAHREKALWIMKRVHE